MIYTEDAFSREDERDDHLFYATDRFVSHLDTLALRTIERIIETLVVEADPVVLDLMSSWDSHLPDALDPARVVGLGLNASELERNPRLTERVIHDLNKNPRLPFDDASFDVVLNTVSVDYMTRPFEIFREVGRVLRPGGLFLVSFSNRIFPKKAVRIWRETSEAKRAHLVQDYFDDTGLFSETAVFVQKGRPRPRDDNDRYSGLGLPSDPVYAVYADRLGATRPRPSPAATLVLPDRAEVEQVRRRSALVGQSLRCPYCEQPLRRWAVPQTPFTEWESEHMYICFNDSCAFFVRGWSVMAGQGNLSFSYRLMYNPDRDALSSIPVQGPDQLRENIVD
jgi:SAM-dependent methyltransferase